MNDMTLKGINKRLQTTLRLKKNRCEHHNLQSKNPKLKNMRSGRSFYRNRKKLNIQNFMSLRVITKIYCRGKLLSR